MEARWPCFQNAVHMCCQVVCYTFAVVHFQSCRNYKKSDELPRLTLDCRNSDKSPEFPKFDSVFRSFLSFHYSGCRICMTKHEVCLVAFRRNQTRHKIFWYWNQMPIFANALPKSIVLTLLLLEFIFQNCKISWESHEYPEFKELYCRPKW